MVNKIFVQVTIYNGIELLPHFLTHYLACGVDCFLVAVGFKSSCNFLRGQRHEQNIADEVIAICRDFPAKVFPFVYEVYAGDDNHTLRPAILNKAHVSPRDWIIYADLDEFYSYPVHLKHLIKQMEAENIQAIQGWIIDRITPDGSLPPIKASPSIFEQFPLGATLTRDWLKANHRKIVLCRADVQVNGAHDTAFGVRFDQVPTGCDGPYHAFHFRWTASLIPRLQERMAHPEKHHPAYVRECNFFLQEIAKIQKLPVPTNAVWFGPMRYPPY